MKQNKEGETNTIIGMVTNGTIMNDEIISYIKDYNIQVTISYDGNPIVNDIMRIFPSGGGTSNIILDNIKKLKEITGQPTTIEVTYNNNHVLNNIAIIDIINYLNDSVGNIPLHITPVAVDVDSPFRLENKDEFIKAVDDIFDKEKNVNNSTYSLVQRIVSSLISKKTSKYICEAGVGGVSISTKGDVYPCFMFTDEDDLQMGNINDNNLFNSSRFKEVINRFDKFNKNDNDECNKCFVRNICSGCLGINYIEKGETFNLSKSYCEMTRSMTERVILNLYKLKEVKKSSKSDSYV